MSRSGFIALMSVVFCVVTFIFQDVFAHFNDESSFFFFSVTEVAESFLELVTDETKDGEALIVLPDGASSMEFPVLG